MSKWPKQQDVNDFYGDPRGANGLEKAAWVTANIVKITPPWSMVTAWDGKPVKTMRVHKKCAESLLVVMEKIWLAAAKDQAKIDAWGMNKYAGGYNFRLMRGSNALSMHSWGCAVDFDSERNGFGDAAPNFANVPAVLDAFRSEDWTWGGLWKRPDGMHWQAAKI
jgi:D-alanyl-D-alanine carboxypeptidase